MYAIRSYYGFIVDAEAVDDGGAGFVHAEQFDRCAFTAELHHYLVQGAHGRDVPEMGVSQIDDHFVQNFGKIEALAKAHGRGKEDLPPDPVRNNFV